MASKVDRAPEKPSYKTVMDDIKQQQYKYDKFETVTEIKKLGKTELKKIFPPSRCHCRFWCHRKLWRQKLKIKSYAIYMSIKNTELKRMLKMFGSYQHHT